jgi:hypothetical protein
VQKFASLVAGPNDFLRGEGACLGAIQSFKYFMNSNEISVACRRCSPASEKVGHRDVFHSEHFSFYGAIKSASSSLGASSGNRLVQLVESFVHDDSASIFELIDSLVLQNHHRRQNFDPQLASNECFLLMVDEMITLNDDWLNFGSSSNGNVK